MYLLTISFILYLVIGTASSVDSNFLNAYDLKVCNNEPTCNLINHQDLVLKNRRNLFGRDCMCDSECVKYGDCCADSEFFSAVSGSKNIYSCSSKWRIYMITDCPDGYADQVVVSKCLASLQNTPDNFLIRPATNLKTHTTYGNAYCALCNNDATNVVLWNLTARCGEAPAGYFDPQNRISETPENNGKVSTPLKNSNPSSESENNDKASTPLKTSKPSSSETEHTDKVSTPSKNSKPPLFPSVSFNNQGVEISALGHTFKPSLKPNFFRRNKREQISVDYNKYRKELDNILENVRYDNSSKRYVSQYKNKIFICEFSSQAPQKFNLNKNARKCIPNVVSSCLPNFDKEIAKKCSLNTAIVYNNELKQAYKNRDCAKCNNIPEGDLTGCPQEERQVASEVLFGTNKGEAPPCDKPEFQNTDMCKN